MLKKRKAKGKPLTQNYTETKQAQLEAYGEQSKRLPPKCQQEGNGAHCEVQDELALVAMMEALGTADPDLAPLSGAVWVRGCGGEWCWRLRC